jgi:TonB family protein
MNTECKNANIQCSQSVVGVLPELHFASSRSYSSHAGSQAVIRCMHVCVVFLMLIGLSCLAASPELMTVKEALKRDLLVVAVVPKYPRGRLTGSGVFDMKFDYESGRLREIHVVQSTGQPKLDANTIAALKQWRAKPRSVHTLRFPITFELALKR